MSRPNASRSSARPHLVPVLGSFSALAIVVGEMIGSGIFFSPQLVAHKIGGYVGLILALWLVCGLVNLCGALALAELSAMFPQEGGTYVFLRETYGPMWSFLWCWAEFWVMRSGAIATLATLSALNLRQALAGAGLPVAAEWQLIVQSLVAIGLIAVLGAVNMAGALWGGRVQNVLTAVKVGFVLLLCAFPFFALRGAPVHMAPLWPAALDRELLLRIGAALAAIMWAYDGWGNVTVLAEELRQPEKTVPRALILGVGLVTLLYCGANLAFHLALPVETIGREFVPAAAAARLWIPRFGEPLVVVMLMISMAGALNGNILVGPRVLFAVARDHACLAPFSRLHPRTRTPVLATAAMCGWAVVLIVLGGLFRRKDEMLAEVLTNYCVFGGSIFYFSAVLAVFVLRVRRPEAPRPYRTWGYPVVPAVFMTFYLFLLGNVFWSRPRESSVGLAFIALGLVVYVLLARVEATAIADD